MQWVGGLGQQPHQSFGVTRYALQAPVVHSKHKGDFK